MNNNNRTTETTTTTTTERHLWRRCRLTEDHGGQFGLQQDSLGVDALTLSLTVPGSHGLLPLILSACFCHFPFFKV